MKNEMISTIIVKDKVYLKELWKQFLESTQEHYWDFYATSKNTPATNNFNNDVISSKFTNWFALHFEKKINEKLYSLTEEKISPPFTGKDNKTSISGPSLLNNYFKVNKFSDDIKDSTRNLFSLYLGYNSYNDFQLKNREHLLPRYIKFYIRHPKKSYFLLSLLILMFGVLTILKTGLPTDLELKETIIEANKAEFEAYKRLPKIDTSKIDKLWTKGIARKRIVDILKKHPSLGRILVDTLKASGAKILEFNVIFKTRYYIRLETEENWHLQWYNVKTKTFEKEYDRVDAQVYILLKENNDWKIWDNWHIKKKETILIH